MTATLLAALNWDPQVRGALIFITAVVILPGSVYLLLATNTGAKVGFLLAAAGLTGWMAVMGWVWVVYGIGVKGEPAHWKPQELVTGDINALSTVDATATFPRGWQKLAVGDSILGDAVASADKVLVPATEDAHGAEAAPSSDHTFTPLFQSPTEYSLVAAYRIGGADCWLPGGKVCFNKFTAERPSNVIAEAINRFRRGPFHRPHYVVIQVAPVLQQESIGGVPPRPVPDPNKPPTNVVMIRDLGNLREPSARIALSMTIVFALIANALHRRDKEILALRTTAAPAAG